MHHGYLSIIKMIETDLEFEKDAVRIYTEFATSETGHVNGLRRILQFIKDGEHEVKFYCPVCGWEVSFGNKPEIGDRARCRMCGVIFELIEIGGDYDIRRL